MNEKPQYTNTHTLTVTYLHKYIYACIGINLLLVSKCGGKVIKDADTNVVG